MDATVNHWVWPSTGYRLGCLLFAVVAVVNRVGSALVVGALGHGVVSFPGNVGSYSIIP